MQNIEAIILAGGSGSRFGGGKLLAPYRGGALIDGAVRTAMSAPVQKVILVTGHDGDQVGAAVLRLAAREYPGQTVQVIRADRFEAGMGHTLSAGVAALSSGVEGAFVFLGDMPRVPLSVAPKLAARIGDRGAAAPAFRQTRGHPVLFAARLFPALRSLTGDRGARGLLEALGDDLALVAVDDAGVVFDVDVPSDLAE